MLLFHCLDLLVHVVNDATMHIWIRHTLAQQVKAWQSFFSLFFLGDWAYCRRLSITSLFILLDYKSYVKWYVSGFLYLSLHGEGNMVWIIGKILLWMVKLSSVFYRVNIMPNKCFGVSTLLDNSTLNWLAGCIKIGVHQWIYT